VQFVGQMVCAGYEWVPGVADVNGAPRAIIVFYLQPIETLDADPPPDTGTATIEEAASTVWSMPMKQLRSTAVNATAPNLPSIEARRNVYRRSAAVRVYVLSRAAGVCEGCGSPAPFTTPQGRPYLEPHHIRRLSDGGPDYPDYMIALCPDCLRRVHYRADGAAFNEELQRTLDSLANV
jgi:5-methylcytosine-specific restriction protein A